MHCCCRTKDSGTRSGLTSFVDGLKPHVRAMALIRLLNTYVVAFRDSDSKTVLLLLMLLSLPVSVLDGICVSWLRGERHMLCCSYKASLFCWCCAGGKLLVYVLNYTPSFGDTSPPTPQQPLQSVGSRHLLLLLLQHT